MWGRYNLTRQFPISNDLYPTIHGSYRWQWLLEPSIHTRVYICSKWPITVLIVSITMIALSPYTPTVNPPRAFWIIQPLSNTPCPWVYPTIPNGDAIAESAEINWSSSYLLSFRFPQGEMDGIALLSAFGVAWYFVVLVAVKAIIKSSLVGHAKNLGHCGSRM